MPGFGAGEHHARLRISPAKKAGHSSTLPAWRKDALLAPKLQLGCARIFEAPLRRVWIRAARDPSWPCVYEAELQRQ